VTVDFATLYERHAAEVMRFSYWLCGDRTLAEDITAETFVRVWTARERVDLTTVTGYLLAIARNLFLQGVARERRRGELADEPADPRPDPHRVAEDRDEAAAVLGDLRSLPEVDRAALLMRATADTPYADIAAALTISEGAAKVKVHRARLKLAEARLRRERTTP
jgi:RNA polymerase sigma-70 factor (ECF subfamily)